MIKEITNKRTKDKKRGDTALLWALLGFLAIITFQGYINMLNQQSVVNELQQQMDVSGLNALNRTIDIEELQKHEDLFNKKMTNEEFLKDYEHKIKQSFREELYNAIRIGGPIKDVKIMEGAYGDGLRVEFIPAPHEGTIGREHILLDAVVRITMENLIDYDERQGEALVFELGRDGNTKITQIRQNVDGTIDLYLHNQTRLQYN